nr:hypothetical protein [Fibrobacterota bacterium]
MEVLLGNVVEIKRSKRLKGQPVLQGDGLTGFQALMMGALAEGPTKLENLPDSPWFRDILQDFIRMGYAQQALDGHWTIHGGNAPVSGPEPLRVRHEAELLTLAGFLAAKNCRRNLAIDPACVSGEAMELLGRILKLEAPPVLISSVELAGDEAGVDEDSDTAAVEADIESAFTDSGTAEETEGNQAAEAALIEMELEEEIAGSPAIPDRAESTNAARDASRAAEAAVKAAEAARKVADAARKAAEAADVILLAAPTGLTPKTASLLHPGGVAAAACKPSDFGWDEYQSKLALLSFHLASGLPLDLSLSKSGPDWLETLAAQFGVPIRVEKNEAPEGDELARRIARQMRAAGKSEAMTRIRLGAGAKLRTQTYTIPADITLASAYCLAATLIKGSDITLENVPLNPSRAGFISALRRMGADIEVV